VLEGLIAAHEHRDGNSDRSATNPRERESA